MLSSLILFSAFNMMSDWFSCFFFTEGVRSFRCWFLMIVFHGLACISLWSFATAKYGKPKCNSVHYLHNLLVNLVLILVNSLLLYLFKSVPSYVYSVQSIESRATLKCGICKEIQNLNYENRIGNGIQNQTGLFLKGKDNKNTKFRLHLCSLCSLTVKILIYFPLCC